MVPAEGLTHLKTAVASHPQGDWELIVKANGKTLLTKLVSKGTTTDKGWLDVSVDLSDYAGKEVEVELLNQANDWHWEAAFWGEIEIAHMAK